MKRLPLFLAFLYCCNSFSQIRLEYGDFIQTNNNIKWAAETDALLNLMPKTAKYSVKNFYLKKLKESSIKVYKTNSDKYSVTSTTLTANTFKLENLDTISSQNLSNNSFPVIDDIVNIAANYATCICDSCARNELFEIFRVKQIISYGNSDLSIKNIFISPLCLKRNTSIGNINDLPLWNVLFNVAFSNGNEIKSQKENLLYLGEEEYKYDFNETAIIENKNKLTPTAPRLTQLIFDDCKKGILKIFDPEKGTEIPYKKLNTWGMQKVAIQVYDADGEGKGGIGKTRYMIQERNLDSLNRFKINQVLYFDRKNEVLLSVVKWIDILEPVITQSGIYLGNTSRFRFYPKNRKINYSNNLNH